MPRPLAAARAGVDAFDGRVDAAAELVRGRPVADRLFYAASELGDFSVVWLILGCLRALRSERDFYAAVRLGISLAVESCLVNGVVKSLFRRTRPPWEGERPRHLRQPRTSSFPSGHATSAFMAAVLLSDGDPLWPLHWAVAGIVASSRVHVGIHHGSDVAAGMAMGVAMGLAVKRLVPLPAPEEAPPPEPAPPARS